MPSDDRRAIERSRSQFAFELNENSLPSAQAEKLAAVAVAKEIRRLVETSSGSGGSSVEAVARPRTTVRATSESGAAALPELGPRSGNLRVRREFSDREKAQFLQDAFEFMARYFENSLAELSSRHAHIQGDFRRIDANTFHAVLYQHGKQVSTCAVRLDPGGSFGSGIRYSQGLGRGHNSFNEQLSVAHDDHQSLFLRSLGMASRGGRDEALTHEGGAELYWSMLVRQVQ